jgi:hypothetical protein
MCSLKICHYLVVTLCMLGPLTCVADGGNAVREPRTHKAANIKRGIIMREGPEKKHPLSPFIVEPVKCMRRRSAS